MLLLCVLGVLTGHSQPVVWFLGHSLIRRLSEYVRDNQLPMPFKPVWNGTSGSGVHRARREFLYMVRTMPEPHMVVLHTGGNDLASMSAGCLRHRLTELLTLIQAALPNTIVVWSDMLPRISYRYAHNSDSVDAARETVNRYVRGYMAKNNMRAIRHSAVTRADTLLFLPDGVHLSDLGNQLFQRELWYSISTFQKSNLRVCHPSG